MSDALARRVSVPLDDLRDLRARIAEVIPAPKVAATAIPSGFAALDAALSSGGVPRGALTELTGPRGSGVTTLARGLVAQAVARGVRVAVIDAGRTLYPRDWVSVPKRDGSTVVPVFIRPPTADRAAWCADVLLRSGAFALVVLDGAPALGKSVAVRLAQLAREADAALVVAGEGRAGTNAGGTVRIRCEPTTLAPPREFSLARRRPAPPREGPSSLRLIVEKGALHPRPLEVSCDIPLARRLCAHPEVPDRRGVAARQRSRARGTFGAPAGTVDPRLRSGADPGVVERERERSAVEHSLAERMAERIAARRNIRPDSRRGRRMGEPRLADGRFTAS